MTTAGTELGLRERKKLKTRIAMRRAAVRLVDERGYEAVTVDDIAEAAEVSTRTFFNYFASKDDAIAGIDKEEIDQIVQAMIARPVDEPPVEALRAVMVARVVDIGDQRDYWRAKMRVVRANPSLREAFHAGWSRYEAALVEVVARRCGLDPDTDDYPAVVVAVALAVTRTVSLRWRDGPGGGSLSDLISTAFDNLAAGLVPPAPAQSETRRTSS